MSEANPVKVKEKSRLAGPVGFVGRHTRREPTTYGLKASV
jgi:hypothetical protein